MNYKFTGLKTDKSKVINKNNHPLPNLFVVGAQKAGTTSLYDILSDCPDFYLPIKELQFFHRNDNYSKGIEWYREHFKNHTEERYIGDFTPDYLAFPKAIERMKKQIGEDVKLIVLLRHPLTRAYSQYNFFLMKGIALGDNFEEALSMDQSKFSDPFKNWYQPNKLISRSIYSEQIDFLLKNFSREKIHIGIFEDLIQKRDNIEIERLESFLSVPLKSYFRREKQGSNPTKVSSSKVWSNVKGRISPLASFIKSSIGEDYYLKLKERLLDKVEKKPEQLDEERKDKLTELYFKDEIERIQSLLGREIKSWN